MQKRFFLSLSKHFHFETNLRPDERNSVLWSSVVMIKSEKATKCMAFVNTTEINLHDYANRKCVPMTLSLVRNNACIVSDSAVSKQ